MPVRAKFVVNSITRHLGMVYDSARGTNVSAEVHTIKLYPVTGSGGDEDRKFWASTPQGSIELAVVNPAAVEDFASQLGQAVYVDFSPADSH